MHEHVRDDQQQRHEIIIVIMTHSENRDSEESEYTVSVCLESSIMLMMGTYTVATGTEIDDSGSILFESNFNLAV